MLLFLCFLAHCIKLNLTIDRIVASRRMLPYARDWKSGEGAYDESTQQARVVRSNPTAISESDENGKKTMLDEFVAASGYHRKYATRLLKHGFPRRSRKKHGLQKVYHGEVVVALEQIWEVCGRICSKRLQPFLPEMV